ncbi:MAG: glycosyltransferase [Candidatus Pacearchaeota archaeon]|jgi:GT2 family glycosyltransferase
MKEPLISIGILNHNGSKYIKNTLNYINKLEYKNKEVIVFDNGSTDNSLKILSGYKDITLIKSKENLGYGIAKNKIVERAKGKYILLLDEDISIIEKSSLNKILKLYNETNPGFLSILLVNRNREETTYYGGYWGFFGYSSRKPLPLNKFLDSSKDFHESQSPEGGAIFFEKDHFLKIKGFDVSQPYYCDVGDLGLRSYILTNKPNLVTHKVYFIHEGMDRKTEFKKWLWKFKYIPMGTLKVLYYNFSFLNILLYTITILFLFFLGAIFKSLRYFSIKPLFVYFHSIILFVMDFPNILKKRKEIQSKRVVKKDSFLKIRKPIDIRIVVLTKNNRANFEIIEPLKNSKLVFKEINFQKKYLFVRIIKIFISFFYILFLRYIRKFNFLFIESADWPLLYSSLLKKCFGYKIIYRARGDIIFELNRKTQETNNTIKIFYYNQCKKSINNIDLVIFCSNWLKKRYSQYNFDKYVVPNAINFKTYNHIKNKKPEIDLLFITSFDFKEKFLPIINFLNKFKEEIVKNNLKIVILGNGKYFNLYKNNLKCINIEFLGYKSNLEEYYNNSKILVHFSNLDAYPLVTLEANLYELPIVVNNDCGMIEQVKNNYNGIILEDYMNKNSFYKIIDLLNNKNIRNIMGENGKKFVTNNHNPKYIGKRFEQHIFDFKLR